MDEYFFTSESVSEGHPDKVSDQISDSVLDACLSQDENSRVACETLVTKNLVVLAGEISSSAEVDFEKVAREAVQKIGYDQKGVGFSYKDFELVQKISEQSPDIARGVDQRGGVIGAGDQGIMFGYAVNETEEKFPLSIDLSHQILFKLAEARKSKRVNFLRPDSKSQVTILYKDKKPVGVDSVVVSTQHTEEVEQKEVHEFVREEIIKNVIPTDLLSDKTKYFVNPTGRFVQGGPQADCGLTGRKIIVDTYGGHGAHGGGAFSGKDSTKVDRSSAYVTRNIAKTLVAAGIMEKCLVQLSYAIGIAQPISIFVDDYGTLVKGASLERVVEVIEELWDLSPRGMIDQFKLTSIKYFPTASYGHFGRRGHGSFTWEETPFVEVLKEKVLP